MKCNGKTAIIDALKLVLLTQSNEYIRPAEDDFYTDETGNSVTEFRIDCVLEKFTDNEAKNFIEYLTFTKEKFSDRAGHRLKEILSNANKDIEKYFIEEDGKVIL